MFNKLDDYIKDQEIEAVEKDIEALEEYKRYIITIAATPPAP